MVCRFRGWYLPLVSTVVLLYSRKTIIYLLMMNLLHFFHVGKHITQWKIMNIVYKYTLHRFYCAFSISQLFCWCIFSAIHGYISIYMDWKVHHTHSIMSPVERAPMIQRHRQRVLLWSWPNTSRLLKLLAWLTRRNICLRRDRWFVTYSPSSDSLSESWLMMSFLCSSACSRAAWSFRGNSEASSSIYKQPKNTAGHQINNTVWKMLFKGQQKKKTA